LQEGSTKRKEDSMKTPKLLFAAASALSLASCATVAPVPVVPGAATLTVATKAPFGTYLVDAAGRAVYILEGERMPGGAHRCGADCLAVWPPVPGSALAGAGVNPALLSSMPMAGGPHATYGGWPLYYYVRDRAPGDTTGQHVTDKWGTWHLLSPSGQPIRPAGGGY
jgi:predicted lipoprotein with Yx(FWY)xxD motif